jgi:hypothetical protein
MGPDQRRAPLKMSIRGADAASATLLADDYSSLSLGMFSGGVVGGANGISLSARDRPEGELGCLVLSHRRLAARLARDRQMTPASASCTRLTRSSLPSGCTCTQW